MKKNAVALPFAVGAFLLAAGCGDDVTKTTVVEDTGISQLAKGEAFPECDSSAAGEMLYAADSGALYICGESGWRTLNGKDTVVVKDTLVQKDTLILSNVDTLIIRDTLVGLNGESCTAEMLKDSSGYKILCGDDSVGVVLNGFDGTNGINGEKGEKGDDGESCTVADSGNGVVTVQCASDTVKLYKALCGTTPYDPVKSFCYTGDAQDSVVALCDGNAYDPVKTFCYKELLVSNLFNQELLAAGTYDTLRDSRDGQIYLTVTIGTQTWMAQNLNYRYTQGTADLDSSSFCYDNDTANCTKYGRLYTWSAAIDLAAIFSNDGENCAYGVTCSLPDTVRGVCPAGWHLPTQAEWEVLFTTVGGEDVAAKALKAKNGWYDDGNGSDTYGFSALPAGVAKLDQFSNLGFLTYFWSATGLGTAVVRYIYVGGDDDVSLLLTQREDRTMMSVRCLKNSD